MKKYKKGLTLIELLVVAAIITILASILLPYTLNRLEDARIARIEEEISSLRSAVALFFNDNSTLPTTWNNFVTNTGFPNTWRGPYINRAPNVDSTNAAIFLAASPWRTNYRIWLSNPANTNNRFAATANLYPFRNGIALEVRTVITGTNPTIPLTSLDKIDRDLDNGNPGSGFIVEANAGITPFVTTTNMAGLTTGTNYQGGGRSVYILLFTY